MSEAALIEELARVMSEVETHDGTGTLSDHIYQSEFPDMARAILPIIRAREIAAGEKVKLRASTIRELDGNNAVFISDAIRALDIPSILKDEA